MFESRCKFDFNPAGFWKNESILHFLSFRINEHVFAEHNWLVCTYVWHPSDQTLFIVSLHRWILYRFFIKLFTAGRFVPHLTLVMKYELMYYWWVKTRTSLPDLSELHKTVVGKWIVRMWSGLKWLKQAVDRFRRDVALAVLSFRVPLPDSTIEWVSHLVSLIEVFLTVVINST